LAGGGADVGDRRVRGVLPEVVGLPGGDLIEQVQFGPAVDSRRGQDRVLELGVLPSAVIDAIAAAMLGRGSVVTGLRLEAYPGDLGGRRRSCRLAAARVVGGGLLPSCRLARRV
jgi:hypothetical protein